MSAQLLQVGTLCIQVLTLAVAALLAYVGIEQMRINRQQMEVNRQRLKRELYDPRLEFYKAAMTLIRKCASRAFSDECFVEFRAATQPRFNLEQPAITFLDLLDTKAQALLELNDELNDGPTEVRRTELAGHRRELNSWFRLQNPQLDQAFASSLTLHLE
jgi:hypothetical protein